MNTSWLWANTQKMHIEHFDLRATSSMYKSLKACICWAKQKREHMGSYSIEKNAKACWAEISESYPSCHQFIAYIHSTQAGMCKSQNLKQKPLSQSPNSSANDFFECILPAFSPAQLISQTLHIHKLEASCRSHSFEQRTNNFWVHLSENFCSLSCDLAHLCLTPSMF
jgi:hypothetical protein